MFSAICWGSWNASPWDKGGGLLLYFSNHVIWSRSIFKKSKLIHTSKPSSLGMKGKQFQRGGMFGVPLLSPLDKSQGQKVMTTTNSVTLFKAQNGLYSPIRKKKKNTKKEVRIIWAEKNFSQEFCKPCTFFLLLRLYINLFEWWRLCVWEIPEIIEKVTNYACLRYGKFFQAFSQSLKFTASCELPFN